MILHSTRWPTRWITFTQVNPWSVSITLPTNRFHFIISSHISPLLLMFLLYLFLRYPTLGWISEDWFHVYSLFLFSFYNHFNGINFEFEFESVFSLSSFLHYNSATLGLLRPLTTHHCSLFFFLSTSALFITLVIFMTFAEGRSFRCKTTVEETTGIVSCIISAELWNA